MLFMLCQDIVKAVEKEATMPKISWQNCWLFIYMHYMIFTARV